MDSTDAVSSPVTVFSPAVELARPKQFLQAMVRDSVDSVEMAVTIAVRNIKGEVRQTVLGLLWAFIPPIVTTLSFVLLESQKIISGDGAGMPYGAYVMIGSLLWQVFVDALNSPLKMVQSAAAMLSAVRFPHQALIFAGFIECMFRAVIRLLLLAVVFVHYDLAPPATLLLAPLGVLLLCLAGMMVGLLLIPLGILYHDVSLGLGMVISFWFFLTPVVYVSPESGLLATLVGINPVTPLLQTTREMIALGSVSHPLGFIGYGVAIIVSFLFSLAVYRLSMPHLIKRNKD